MVAEVIRVSQGGNGRFYPYVYVGTWYTCDGGLIDIDQWSYIALTYDGETMKAYLNGNFVCENTGPSGNLSITGPTTIGSNATPGEFFHGLIDEVRVYDQLLFEVQIKQLYVEGAESLGLDLAKDN